MARAPVTGWTDCDRGPRAYAEERITSAHRAIEIREKRRGPLVAFDTAPRRSEVDDAADVDAGVHVLGSASGTWRARRG